MLGRLFRLPPIVYFVLAPVLAVLGIVMFFTANSDDAARAAALAHAAPDPVELQSVTSAETGNDMNEIVVLAQADFDNAMVLERTKNGRVRSSESFIPLYPTDAQDLSGPVAAVMEIDGDVSDEWLAKIYKGDGPAGPVFMINGIWDGSNNGDIAKAFEGYKEVSDGTVYTVRPFMQGREAGLKQRNTGPVFLIAGFVLALILGGYGYFRKRRLEAAKAREEAAYAEA